MKNSIFHSKWQMLIDPPASDPTAAHMVECRSRNSNHTKVDKVGFGPSNKQVEYGLDLNLQNFPHKSQHNSFATWSGKH